MVRTVPLVSRGAGPMLLLGLVAAMLVAPSASAGSPAGEPGSPCSQDMPCHFRGVGFQSSWSTVPVSGPEPGVTYRESVVAAVHDGGPVGGHTSLLVDVFEFSVDGDGAVTPLRETWTFLADPGLRLVQAGLLSSASLSGQVSASVCDFETATCQDEVVTIDVALAGSGPLYSVVENSRTRSDGTVYIESSNLRARVAMGRAAVGGADLGRPAKAVISETFGTTISITHPAISRHV